MKLAPSQVGVKAEKLDRWMMRRLLVVLTLLAIATTLYWLLRLPDQASIKLEAPKTVAVGQIFDAPLRVSIPSAINAAEFYFSFPKDKLEVVEIKKEGSFFTLWITDFPRFSNESGALELAGGLPKPGFSGKNGLVATVVFKAKAAGEAVIGLDSQRSRLLANDGLGTQVVSTFQPVTINIK